MIALILLCWLFQAGALFDVTAANPPDVGAIRITTDPAGAEIEIEGVPAVSKSPCLVPELPVGKRYLILTPPNDYLPMDTMFTVRANTTGTLIVSFVRKSGKSGISNIKFYKPKRNIYFGMQGGFNVSTLVGNDVPNDGISSGAGILLGSYFEFPFSDRYRLQSELIFTVNATSLDNDLYKYTQYLSYLEIPLLLKVIGPAISRTWRLNFLAGPTMRNLVLAQVDDESPSNSDMDVKAYTNPRDYGIIIGINVDNSASNWDLRFYRGLKSIDKVSNLSVFNQSFSLRFGYKFKL